MAYVYGCHSCGFGDKLPYCPFCKKPQHKLQVPNKYKYEGDVKVVKQPNGAVVIRRKGQLLSKREIIYNRDGNKCLNCGTEKNLTLDHIIPKCEAMARNRLKDVTYTNWYDDYDFIMNRRQFKKWFKEIGSPSDFDLWLTSNGNEVYNYKTQTELM